MMMSDIVKTYLEDRGIDYQLSSHRRTATSPAGCGWEYLMVVIPADSRVDDASVDAEMGTHFELPPTQEVESLLDDCAPGAIPPVGRAYGLETLVDDSLDAQNYVYFEAGDHEHLVHVNGNFFHKLLSDCRHGHYSTHGF